MSSPSSGGGGGGGGGLFPSVFSLSLLMFALIFQQYLSPLIFNTFGVLRPVQPLSDFPQYSCRKIHHPLLRACEDLYLDETRRTLYAACSEPANRKVWTPSVERRNVSARTGKDHITVIENVDGLVFGDNGAVQLPEVKALATEGYVGAFGPGDTSLDLHGFDVEELGGDSETLRFWLVNHRPAVDEVTSAALNQDAVGVNSTIEAFDLVQDGASSSTTLKHVKTYADPAVIKTPNRVVATGQGTGESFVLTNDRMEKVGLRRQVEVLIGGGSLAYCGGNRGGGGGGGGGEGGCRRITAEKLAGPNGLTRGADGLYYVPSSLTGYVSVFAFDAQSPNPQQQATHLADIKIGMPIDNLRVDSEGSIWAAAFPKAASVLSAFDEPETAKVPTAVFRIKAVAAEEEAEVKKNRKERGVGEGEVKVQGGYSVEKMLEDRDSEQLPPGTTTVLHDVKTGRLFFGGVFAPFITVCEEVEW